MENHEIRILRGKRMTYKFLRLTGGTIAKVGQVFKDNVYPCGYCMGIGIEARNRSTCFVCKGTGTVELKGPVVVCAYCRGTGRGHSGSIVTCTVCKGRGVVAVKEPVKFCPTCRGTGRSSSGLTCLRCKGKGVVEKS